MSFQEESFFDQLLTGEEVGTTRVCGAETTEENSVPVWWNSNGVKLAPFETNLSSHALSLILVGPKAQLCLGHGPGGNWSLRWEVDFAEGEGVQGRVILSEDELLRAFSLAKMGKRICPSSLANSARPGRYLRWGQYLNVPGPGTGNDGDPNLSVLVSKKIQEEIGYLIRASW